MKITGQCSGCGKWNSIIIGKYYDYRDINSSIQCCDKTVHNHHTIPLTTHKRYKII